MNRLSTIMLFAAIIILFITGCGQSSDQIASTIESQVASSIKATVEFLPTATPADTHTPVPTFTPQATYTPVPTLTAQPTFTPQATYTPFPTVTPTSENTATAVPTLTATRSTLPTAVPPTSTSSISNLAILKTEFVTMLVDIDMYLNSIRNRYFSADKRVNCLETVAIRDRIVTTITLDVSQDVPIVQDAYAVYQNAAHQFGEDTAAWDQGCQEAIADGDPMKNIDSFQSDTLTLDVAVVQSWLNAANDQLNSLGE